MSQRFSFHTPTRQLFKLNRKITKTASPKNNWTLLTFLMAGLRPERQDVRLGFVQPTIYTSQGQGWLRLEINQIHNWTLSHSWNVARLPRVSWTHKNTEEKSDKWCKSTTNIWRLCSWLITLSSAGIFCITHSREIVYHETLTIIILFNLIP